MDCPSTDEFLLWLAQAYRQPQRTSNLDGPLYTRWNMEVAYQAGFARALAETTSQETTP